MSDEVDDFLAHYGVKGMKWGVRRSDEQLARAAQKREQRVEKRQSKGAEIRTKANANRELMREMDELGIQSPALRDLYGKAADQSDRMFLITHLESKNAAVKRHRDILEKETNTLEKDADALERGKMSPTTKKLIVGGAIAGTMLVAYGAYRYPDIVTMNAKPGQKISVNNFMRRYEKRAANWSNKPLTRSQFDKLSDVDTVVPKGTVFSRLTAYKDETLGARLYTTFNDTDNDKYRGLYGPMLKQRTKAKELFVNEYKMGTSIKSPSHKKRISFLMEMMDEEFDTGVDASGNWIKTKGIDLLKEQVGKTGDVSDPSDFALKHYARFARELVGEHPLNEVYFDKVRSRGYNAIVDDNDAGQLSDTPLILLDAAKSVVNRKSTPLTKEMEKEARKRLTEIHGL